MKEERAKSIFRDRKGFTGLEAAIVLTAFVVVAAVFSYMVLGAGFFSTEKAKAVVHTGVESATSSAELVGDVIGIGDGTEITTINFTIQLTAGQNPVDLNKSVISFTNKSIHNESVTWTYTVYQEVGSSNNLLEANEKAEIMVYLAGVDDAGLVTGLGTYNKFTLEFKPELGGTLPIIRTTPGALYNVTRLYS
ncbi:MAG: flagellin [Methanophagales archaeon]|nr:flagellin [Methanophagales archaeon]